MYVISNILLGFGPQGLIALHLVLFLLIGVVRSQLNVNPRAQPTRGSVDQSSRLPECSTDWKMQEVSMAR